MTFLNRIRFDIGNKMSHFPINQIKFLPTAKEISFFINFPFFKDNFQKFQRMKNTG